MAIFADRAEAGRELADELADWRGADAAVLGIPRGGVVVAAEVARALGLPLGVAVVRKLGAPSHEEFAVGAIADGVRIVDPAAVRQGGVTAAQLASVEERERAELERRTRAFGPDAIDVAGRTVIIVDDGVATGSTALAACRAQRARKAGRVILAVPVAPAGWRPEASVVDAYVCPHRIADFWAVGQFYEDFSQTEDEEVARLLARDLP
ncbi:phosphoribosyltransferase family protein [Microbacterium sp. BK668]|uniref:phosphoribosyltransferase n=1 Tax=Microbacterium sp. BK668 TaxID=2512118 RepID=UPI00105F8608|nr:phosphoribosyltransferase family protein [Microbacterium sp. BK668]TDN92985.1 putative phosphoribosyltransferase [Microbacterium sp. BK668]